MPNDNIIRSIKKASGDGGSDNIEEITYEGYGPSGIAIIVEAVTDNRNRTAGDLRHFFDKYGGNLGSSGCVSFMFDKKGILAIENNGEFDEDQMMMDALEAGAEDFTSEDGVIEIITEPDNFSEVRDIFTGKGFEFLEAEISMIPQNYIKIQDDKQTEQMQKLLDSLEDMDDVMNVYHNWDA
jgi:YebC/PmpR family DNA-binding regulatory protein